MVYDVSIPANRSADNTDKGISRPWIVAQDDRTRGNLFWAIASGRIPKNVAARLRWVDGCWRIAGATDSDGYGLARVGERTRRVHRLVYEAVFGAIPDGYDLHHDYCGRKDCVDPRHVVAIPHGTHSRLTRIAAGAKLSMRIAEDIRARYAEGDTTLVALAAHYKVTEPTVRDVLTGRTWKGVA
jgi:hypothetical protein